MDETEEKVDDVLSAKNNPTIESVSIERQDLIEEAIQAEAIVKFLQGVFSLFDLPTKIMVSGSAREGTRIPGSDIDIVIVPTHVLVSEDSLEYDRNKPCHVRMRVDLAPDILKQFRHANSDYISVNSLKNFERTEVFPAIVSWDSVRNLVNTPFNIRKDTFDLLTKTKVGLLLQTVKINSSFKESFDLDNTKKVLSEHFLDDWVDTVKKSFPEDEGKQFMNDFENRILNPDKLEQFLKNDSSKKSDHEKQLSNSILKISKNLLGPLRPLNQKYRNDRGVSGTEPISPIGFLANTVKHLKECETRVADPDKRENTQRKLSNSERCQVATRVPYPKRCRLRHDGAQVANCQPKDVFDCGRVAEELKTIITNEMSCDANAEQSNWAFKCVKSLDFLPMLKCTGKPYFFEEFKRRNRIWPSSSVIDDMIESEFGLVCKYPSDSLCPDVDFQLSFNDALSLLAQNMSPNQKRCLRLLKFLKNKVHSCVSAPGETLITSYHIRTALYWFSENVDDLFWEHTSLLECARTVMNFMFPHMRDGTLSHYFIPQMNVLTDINKTNMTILLNLWNQLYFDPLRDLNLTLMLSPNPVSTSQTVNGKNILIGDNVVTLKSVAASESSLDKSRETLYHDREALLFFKDFVDDSYFFPEHGDGDRAGDNSAMAEITKFIATKLKQKIEKRNFNKKTQILSLLKDGFHEISSLMSMSDCLVESNGSFSKDLSNIHNPSELGDNSVQDAKVRLIKVFADLFDIAMGQKQSNLQATSLKESCPMTSDKQDTNRPAPPPVYRDNIRDGDTLDMDTEEISSSELEQNLNVGSSDMDVAGDVTPLKTVVAGVCRRFFSLLQDSDKEDFDENMDIFFSESKTNLISACEANNFFSQLGKKLEMLNKNTEPNKKQDDIELD